MGAHEYNTCFSRDKHYRDGGCSPAKKDDVIGHSYSRLLRVMNYWCSGTFPWSQFHPRNREIHLCMHQKLHLIYHHVQQGLMAQRDV